MKYAIKTFKSLQHCLKELEPFIRNGRHLRRGKPFENFGDLRSRELLANWLLCAVGNSEGRAWTFMGTRDPIGGDGIICDTETDEAWPTEHVMVPRIGKAADVGAAVLEAVASKQAKGGVAYAAGKTLVVFTDTADADGSWQPNKIALALPKLDFATVWVVGLQGVQEGRYNYGVTHLDVTENGRAPVWVVRISKDFASWDVERRQ